MDVTASQLSPLLALPNEISAQIIATLDFESAKSFSRTCSDARYLVGELVPDRVICQVARAVVCKDEFFLGSMSAYCRHEEMVCSAIRVDPRNYAYASDHLQKSAKVLKVTAVSQLFFGEGISDAVERTSRDIGLGPFVDAIRALRSEQYPSKERWKKRGLALLFDSGKRFFQLDTDVFFALLHQNLKKALRYPIPSFLEDRQRVLGVLSKDVRAVLGALISARSSLLEDRGFVVIALGKDFRATLNALVKVRSSLLEDREFVLDLLENDFRATLNALVKVRSSLLEDREFVLYLSERDFWAALDALRKAFSGLLGGREFVCDMLERDLDKTLKILRLSHSRLLEDSQFVFDLLEKDEEQTLRLLMKTHSSILGNRQFMLVLLRKDVKSTLSLLRRVHSVLLDDAGFMFISLTLDTWATLDVLKGRRSNLLESRWFVFAAFEWDEKYTLEVLRSSRSHLLESEFFWFSSIERGVNEKTVFAYAGRSLKNDEAFRRKVMEEVNSLNSYVGFTGLE